MAVALGCTLTQFDHFVLLAMMGNDDKFGFGTLRLASNQKEPLLVVQRGPLVQIPTHSFPVRVLLRGVKTRRHLNNSTRRVMIAATAVLLPQICYQDW